MDKTSLSTSGNPKVRLKASGNLFLKGWEENEVVVKSHNPEDVSLEQVGEEISITCGSDSTVKVPFASQVTIEEVDGQAKLKSLDGEVIVQNAAADLTLRNVGPTSLGRVHGNLVAKNIAGALNIEAVDGNLIARSIQGDFTVKETLQGNLDLEDISGNAAVQSSGNILVDFDPGPGNSYRFSADGNLICRLPDDASVQVEIQRVEGRLQVKLPEVEVPDTIQAPYSLTLNEGDAHLELSAGGNLLLSSQPPELELEDLDLEFGEDIENLAETISQQVSQQVEAQMDMLEQQLDSQMENLTAMFGSHGISPERAEQIARRAREAAERAQSRSQERIQHAQERLQRKLESARRRAEVKARAAEHAARDRRHREPPEWGFGHPHHAPHPPFSPEAPKEPVTDEERMMILGMLEEGKISVEEAERLLSALEEGSGD